MFHSPKMSPPPASVPVGCALGRARRPTVHPLPLFAADAHALDGTGTAVVILSNLVLVVQLGDLAQPGRWYAACKEGDLVERVPVAV